MQSFIDPAILFFVFGILAGSVKSNPEIPPLISPSISLSLLMTLGHMGGFAGVRHRWPADVRKYCTVAWLDSWHVSRQRSFANGVGG